jgi:hypothetical protein
MRRNKLNNNPKSKLSKLLDENELNLDNEPLNIINQESKVFPTSFRLRKIDIERLEDCLKKINDINISHPINKTYLVRGLIMLASEYKPEKMLEYIKKSL